MKVLYFHQHFSTPKGSTGIRSYMMAKALVEQGVEVEMVCGSFGAGKTGLSAPFIGGRRDGVVDGIRVVEFDISYNNKDGFLKRGGLFLSFALKSMVHAVRSDCDVVFATTTPLTAALPGIAARWIRRKPFVFEVRDLWPELPKAMGVIRNPLVLAALGLLESAAYLSANRLVGLAPGIVEGIQKKASAKKRVALIPNGCDVTLFDSIQEARRPPAVPTDNLLAVYTGTHGLANGLDAVLNAASELKKRCRTDITICLVGDGMEKARLQERAEKEGLDNVLFLSPVPKQELVELMNASDVGLQVLDNVPAFYQGTSPNKFFDYLSAGKPILCNYPGWVADIIEQNRCGFAVNPGLASEFADALERAADDRDALVGMGAASKEVAQRDFNRAKLATIWCDFVLKEER